MLSSLQRAAAVSCSSASAASAAAAREDALSSCLDSASTRLARESRSSSVACGVVCLCVWGGMDSSGRGACERWLVGKGGRGYNVQVWREAAAAGLMQSTKPHRKGHRAERRSKGQPTFAALHEPWVGPTQPATSTRPA